MLIQLNGEEIDLPDDLVESENLLKSVVSLDTWETFSDEEKANLMKYIPEFSSDDFSRKKFKEDTVSLILSGDSNFKFGNPVESCFEKLKSGHFSPNVIKMKEKCLKLKIKNYKLQQKEYFKKLLKEVIVMRQAVLDKAYTNSPDTELPKKMPEKEYLFQPMECRVQKKYAKILRDVAVECRDDEISSDDNSSLIAQTSSMKGANSFLTNDITEGDFRKMIEHHQQRRLMKESHPELDTTNISIADVIVRCNSVKKPLKSKKSSKKKKGKLKKKRPVNSNSNSNTSITLPVMPQSKPSTADKTSKNEKSPVISSTEKKKKEKAKAHGGFPKLSCFFSLLGYFFEKEADKRCSRAKIQEKIVLWQAHKSSDNCGWKALYSNWLPLIDYAIDYLIGQGSGSMLPEFIPLLLPDSENEWMWTGPEYSNDDVILPLCNHWMDTLNKVLGTNHDENVKKEKDASSRTNQAVRKSTDEERKVFHDQEKTRYENAHKPFAYKTREGCDTVVGPVKGIFNSGDVSTCKAREHPMLISERAPYVTILCLVRDSVARLPNGEGTRVDVCTLLKDSQFLNPEVCSTQVHGVVSGALDRLHAEKDPCVKFDPIRKVWIYLHRTRSFEEFEKIHEASAAAALAKKQLAQAQKKKKRVSTDPIGLEGGPSAKSSKKDNKKKTKLEESISKKTIADETEPSITEKPTTEGFEPTSDVNGKKKPTSSTSKRKQSSCENISSEIKLPKLNTEQQLPSSSSFQDFNLSLENEALMATQSILGNDENDGTDLFSKPVSGFDDFKNTASELFPGLSNVTLETQTNSEDQAPIGMNLSDVSMTTTLTPVTNIGNASITTNLNEQTLSSMLLSSNTLQNMQASQITVTNKSSKKKQIKTQPIQLLQKQENIPKQQQQRLQHVVIQQSQQQQDQLKPQSFIISTQPQMIGKVTIPSKHFSNNVTTATKTKISEKSDKKRNVVQNIRVQTAPIVTLHQTSTQNLGLTLGNISSTSLQNLNQLIAGQKMNPSKTTAASSLTLLNKTTPVNISEVFPSPSSLLRGKSVPATKTKDLNVWSTIQTPTSVMQQLLPVGSCNEKLTASAATTAVVNTQPSVFIANQQQKQLLLQHQQQQSATNPSVQPSTVFFTTHQQQHSQQPQQHKTMAAKTVTIAAADIKKAGSVTPTQTLSLHQLMALARAPLVQNPQTTLASNISTPRMVARSTANTLTPTLQALLHVVQRNSLMDTSSTNSQLLIQPQSTGQSSNVTRVVRLPKSLLQQHIVRASSPSVLQPPLGANISVRGRAAVAPLKISLPRTGNFVSAAGSSVRLRSPISQSVARMPSSNIVFHVSTTTATLTPTTAAGLTFVTAAGNITTPTTSN